jgi:hypothetical protein
MNNPDPTTIAAPTSVIGSGHSSKTSHPSTSAQISPV